MHSNLPGPTKAICYREVFTIRRVCYERFHCIKYTWSCIPTVTRIDANLMTVV